MDVDLIGGPQDGARQPDVAPAVMELLLPTRDRDLQARYVRDERRLSRFNYAGQQQVPAAP